LRCKQPLFHGVIREDDVESILENDDAEVFRQQDAADAADEAPRPKRRRVGMINIVAAVPSAVLGHHHFRLGPVLLLVIVAVAVAFGVSRLAARRRSHSLDEGANFDTRATHGIDRGSAAPVPDAVHQVDVTPEPTPGNGVPDAAPVRSSIPSSGAPVGEETVPTRPRELAGAASDGDWAVETHGLTKRFGDTVAVDNVELFVPRGSAFGYLGPNGAGKTTLIRTLLGLTSADSGSMSLLGYPVPRDRREALARVGAIVDEPRFHRHLTGRQNLALLAAARGNGADGRIVASLDRVGLAHFADRKVASYSMGMRQRLGVASCLLGDPLLLILDEPMNGLDPAGMQEMRTMIASLADEGRTVVLSSHLLDEVERTCDAVAIVDHGKVIRQGPISSLIASAGASEVRVDCSNPDLAQRVVQSFELVSSVEITESGIAIRLAGGTARESVAEVNRRLVDAGISVYGIREARASLEDWFLSVTSRLGESS
jgi:ABC-2 type transport system ATP-binding protein